MHLKLGWLMGLEPTTTGITILSTSNRINDLSDKKYNTLYF